MRLPEDKLISLSAISAVAVRLRAEGKRIVTTNGCFDLLHWGHIKYLSEARRHGDVLICGVNSDVSVRGLKGTGRPMTAERIRALQVAGLESVDFVCIFDDSTPERFLAQVKPDVHVKGGDYQDKPMPERALVEGHGGRIVLIALEEGFSTTGLIERLRTLSD